MMLWQLIVGNMVLILLIFSVSFVLRKFDTEGRIFFPLYIILFLFSLGFAFRLNENTAVVDMGFYFTDISFLFVNVIFTAALLLGQKKYWKLK